MSATHAFQGPSYAPNYSLAAQQACIEITKAETHLLETLRSEYPENAQVRVFHHRGSFEATVIGWSHHGACVFVRNNATGKCSKPWFAHVGLLPDAQEGGAA